jgi:thiamine biosynthesis lipoprotein
LGVWPAGREEKVPAEQALAQARQRVGYQHLRIEGDQLCKDAAVEVDFNSIAAGYAVDTIAARLEALGIHDYLAEATGELKAAGTSRRFAVAHRPGRTSRRSTGGRAIIAVDGFGLSTSGDYRIISSRMAGVTPTPSMPAPVRRSHITGIRDGDSSFGVDGRWLIDAVVDPWPGAGWDYAEKHDIGAFL